MGVLEYADRLADGGDMKVLLYRGTGPTSRLIRFQTRSPYSHAAMMMDDGTVIEARMRGGVKHVATPWTRHRKNTPVEVYAIKGDFDEEKVESFLLSQLGKKYDWLSVLRFVSRRKAPADDRWFCSELILAALLDGGKRLLNGLSSVLSPRDMQLSTELEYEKTMTD